MKITLARFLALLFIFAAAAPAFAASPKPGRYKGTCIFTQTLAESGLVVKKTFAVTGRIRDNFTCIFLGAPTGVATNRVDGRLFSGTINTGLIKFGSFTGVDNDGNTFTGQNLPYTFTAGTLRLDWTFTFDYGQTFGDTVNRRVFLLKRIGD